MTFALLFLCFDGDEVVGVGLHKSEWKSAVGWPFAEPSLSVYAEVPQGRRCDDTSAARTEAKTLFNIILVGMTCDGSVEKANKRLSGIHEAAIDVLNGRGQVNFFSGFVSIS